MAKYTKEDILRILEENDVKFIRLQFTDIFGTLKNGRHHQKPGAKGAG